MARARSYGAPGAHATPPRLGPIAWARRNLFSSALNVALTLLGAWMAGWLAYAVADWALLRAVFPG